MKSLLSFATRVCGEALDEVAYQQERSKRLASEVDGRTDLPNKSARAPGSGEAWEEDAYAAKVAGVIPADVTMFSGCRDSQTSADLTNVDALFRGPQPAGRSAAGGACTTAFLKVPAALPPCGHRYLNWSNWRVRCWGC